MVDQFNFSEALSFIESGLTVQLTINGKCRLYKLNEDNQIICIPNKKSYCTYVMKGFQMDAIRSNEWSLYEEEKEEI